LYLLKQNVNQRQKKKKVAWNNKKKIDIENCVKNKDKNAAKKMGQKNGA
jgi:hypothetical protein